MEKKSKASVRAAIIGCGLKAQDHAREMLKQQSATQIVVVSEPSPSAYDAMASVFAEVDTPVPPNQPQLDQLLTDYGDDLDIALIVTPHAFHFEQAKACLEAGLDVLLEKPMVVTADEARQLIETRDRVGRLLVIAFNGSLSPQIRTAAKYLRSGDFGEILTINATVWEGWSNKYVGHWKQDPDISGGGFMFDTGAHMLNTVSDLVGEDFRQVAAWLDNRSSTVDILGVVMGRLDSGALVTMNACGATMQTIGSEIRIHCTEGIIRTGIWGEFLETQRPNESPVSMEVRDARKAWKGVWEQFLAVRNGEIENPSPPEIGLRMAKLWDGIKLSAKQDGVPINLDNGDNQ
jgi:predicted dehydrogenase